MHPSDSLKCALREEDEEHNIRKETAEIVSIPMTSGETRTRKHAVKLDCIAARGSDAEFGLDRTSRCSRKAHTVDATTTILARWALPIVFSYLLVGTFLLSWLETWSRIDSLYFCVTVLTTVGYGDIVPKNGSSKAFCCIYVVCGVSMVSASVGVLLGRLRARINMDKMFTKVSSDSLRTMLTASFSMCGVVIPGAIFVYVFEGWSALDSVYWAIITCTSVGLGDFAVSSASRTFGLAYLFIGVGTFAASAASIVHTFADWELQRAVSEFVAGGVTEELILEMDEKGAGCVNKADFLTYMLVHTGKVSHHDICCISDLFTSLDVDSSGIIDTNDIRTAMHMPSVSKDSSPSTPSKKKHFEAQLLPKQARRIFHQSASVCIQLAKSMATTLSTIGSASSLKVVDAALAAITMCFSTLFLHSVDASGLLPISVFSPPMLASSIIFFGGAQPPPAGVFALGTCGAFFSGLFLQQVVAIGLIPAQCLAAGALLFFFKVSGSFFVPTVGLAAFLAQSKRENDHMMQPLVHLATWCAGHWFSYCSAWAFSGMRQYVRTTISKTNLKRNLCLKMDAPSRESQLKEIFDRYDTSGDGFLDAMELKLALRYCTGADVEIEDCERIVRSMDTDGDGVIDFHEFALALDDQS